MLVNDHDLLVVIYWNKPMFQHNLKVKRPIELYRIRFVLAFSEYNEFVMAGCNILLQPHIVQFESI